MYIYIYISLFCIAQENSILIIDKLTRNFATCEKQSFKKRAEYIVIFNFLLPPCFKVTIIVLEPRRILSDAKSNIKSSLNSIESVWLQTPAKTYNSNLIFG